MFAIGLEYAVTVVTNVGQITTAPIITEIIGNQYQLHYITMNSLIVYRY